MAVSIFDLFKIGIGPSSSHTVGPMRAAYAFCRSLKRKKQLKNTDTILCELFGSLAHTGHGHATDKAILLRLSGYKPDKIEPDLIPEIVKEITNNKKLKLFTGQTIDFDPVQNLIFNKNEVLPLHSNGIRFSATAKSGTTLLSKEYYSVDGGFIITHNKLAQKEIIKRDLRLPYPFSSGAELIKLCALNNMSIAEIMYENEMVWRTRKKINMKLDKIWQAFQDCVQRGFEQAGELPGGLMVKRRAPGLYQNLKQQSKNDPLRAMDWVNAYALAVSEENAAGSRVVTAPTNGAAGIIPAVLHYYQHFAPDAGIQDIHNFILTAGAIGLLYKENASISGAEVGCQGEVGVACSMAAAGLAAAYGGSVNCIENAAEIAMEHNLGLTCDPIDGLVQIPCIERNAMGAVKAINAYRIAAQGDGEHQVSLDKVIKTMQLTGADMKEKYKETSRGGLALNIIEC